MSIEIGSRVVVAKGSNVHNEKTGEVRVSKRNRTYVVLDVSSEIVTWFSGGERSFTAVDNCTLAPDVVEAASVSEPTESV